MLQHVYIVHLLSPTLSLPQTIKSLNSSINKHRDSLSSVAKAAAAKPHPTGNKGSKVQQPTPPPGTSTSSLQQQADQLRIEVKSKLYFLALFFLILGSKIRYFTFIQCHAHHFW